MQRTGSILLVGSVALAVHGAACWIRGESHGVPPQVSGAYRALNFWGDSRAYPHRSIPESAYRRAVGSKGRLLRSAESSAPGTPLGIGGVLRVNQGRGWEPLGPANCGGRTLNLAFHPDDANTIFAGSASGGLWKTTSAGVGADAWSRVETGFPDLGVASIEFDPADSDVIYLGTGEVYNHAQSGDQAADRGTRGSYGIGILKSVDGGASWTQTLAQAADQNHGVWAVRVDPSDSQVVWAATTDGVYKSVDAGVNWSQSLNVIMATDLAIHPTIPGVVLVGCGNLGSTGRGLYRTLNNGTNWTQLTGGGIPSDFGGKIQLGVTEADPNVVYASIGNGFTSADAFTWLLRSDDFGTTWQLKSTADYSRWQGWFAHDVAVHPQDPDTVVCVGIDVWTSTNGGSSLVRRSNFWNYFTGAIAPGGTEGLPDYSHADHHDVIYHPTDPNTFYVANDGGVYRSEDSGLTYEALNGGYQTSQFYNGFTSDPNDPNLAMGGLQDNASAIYRGTNAWDRWVLGGDGGWSAIDPTAPNVVYATAQNLFVGRSTNGGVSFSTISPPNLGGPIAFIAPFVQAPSNPQVLYGGSSYLFRSINGGNSWSTRFGGAPLDGNPLLVLAVAKDNADVIYAASAPDDGNRGRVHVSDDGGATFTDITGPLPDRYPGDLAVDPTDEATVYLAVSGFGSSHLYRSTNYGATWKDLDRGRLPDVPATAVAIDPRFPEHIYVGNDLGVFITLDGGEHWVPLDKGLPDAVLVADLSVSPANRKLRVATHGQGVFERDLIQGRRAWLPGPP